MTINTQTIPFVDLTLEPEIASEIEAAVLRVTRSAHFILGEDVETFEHNFATYTQAKHCVGVGSGLDALHLALRAMGVGPGDEVIVPSHTYIATWLAVSHCGATIVPVEPVDKYYVIDPAKIERAITEKTKVIIPVHMYGMPADLDPIIDLARRYNLKVLEDAAQCHGVHYKNKRIGTHGDAVAWSFYPTKNLGAMGDGGAVTTNNAELVQKIRCLGNYGSSKKYRHEEKGFNSRLDPMQAAVLNVKLNYLDKWNNQRKILADRYRDGLRNSGVILPSHPIGTEHVWHLYVIRFKQRDKLVAALSEQGVSTQIHYPLPPHLQPAYGNMAMRSGDYSIAKLLAEEVISLPMWPRLSFEAQDQIIDTIVNVSYLL